MELSEWREELAGVLRKSDPEPFGDWGTWSEEAYYAKFADDALASPAMARLLAEVRAEALREAADEIPAQVSISFEVRRRIGDWLRDRATTAHPTDEHAGEAK